jgi:hypothetical protein
MTAPNSTWSPSPWSCASRARLFADPQEMLGLPDEVKNDVHDAVEALRTLAHGSFPPLLAFGRLCDALPGPPQSTLEQPREPVSSALEAAGLNTRTSARWCLHHRPHERAVPHRQHVT